MARGRWKVAWAVAALVLIGSACSGGDGDGQATGETKEPIVIGASLAFLGGMAFGYYVVLPVTLEFLLTFGSEFAEPNIRIGNYIGFVTRMLLIMGLVGAASSETSAKPRCCQNGQASTVKR